MAEEPTLSHKQRPVSSHRPMQQRSRQRREEILLITGVLLERVGFDGLTTILIARELKISVGSLYHYFPNKQAILYAMAEHWLAEYSLAHEARRARNRERARLLDRLQDDRRARRADPGAAVELLAEKLRECLRVRAARGTRGR